ncbi:MAG: transporter [Alphaproteobacteria bacterium]|nr:transporter [Alphaproteobacteria bacterium]
MLSYRYMRMDMQGNRIGTEEVTPNEIVTTVPNTNPVVTPAGATVVPPLLRVVPTKMMMDMHMLGAMHAPTDNITLMAMLPIIRKSMDHITYAPGTGTNQIGGFTTVSEGIGDFNFSALYRLYDDQVNHLHLNLGISAPTGSTDERDGIFDPFGRTPEVRLPYAMQLGTGTWDLLPGITYTARMGDLSWGAQYRGEVRIEDENDEGYDWGDKHMVTGWAAYQFAPWISTSFRAAYQSQGKIDGRDLQIGGPVQTANPEYYGGERLELFGGVNLIVPEGPLQGHRFAFEAGVPVYQDLNGPQLETDWTFVAGWQKAF